jgi:hypothetical protein
MINLSDSEILQKGLVGIEFEFYANVSLEETTKQLAEVLGKKIRIEKKHHSEFAPNQKEFKIEPDMSGGAGLMELVTGALPYSEGRMIIIKVCDWINKNGYTSDRSSIHLNLSFDPKLTGNKYQISRMSPLKFILDFKEEQVWKAFPMRKESAYAKSIKFVLPRTETYIYDGNHINQTNFIFPQSKYYGVNFEKLPKNYLEFRYVGGEDWHKKQTKILNLLDSFLLQLWNTSTSEGFSSNNKLELKRILTSNKKIINARLDWRNINKGWKDITLQVDLNDDPNIIDIYWPQIKDRVIHLFTNGQLDKGHINYDSDTGRVQVEGGNLPYCFDIMNYEFIKCNIMGELTQCDIFQSDVKSANLLMCNLYQGTQVTGSKIGSCYVNKSCVSTNCYVHGIDGVYSGRMNDGIFREGKYTKDAIFKDTEIIDSKKI